ncbi:MAG: DUF4465 domain-containing protein [Crocinitomicaceae bacterium]
MKKQFLTVFIAGLTFSSFAQLVDFETPLNFSDTAWFGQDQVIDGDTNFVSGALEFETNYNATWQSFSGWGYSNSTDITTPGFGNQFSTITGGGAQNSDQFGICYTSGNTRAFSKTGVPLIIEGGYFSNTTYAYLSMQDGDMFTKKFGDSTNADGVLDGTNGEDWFRLTIYGLDIDSNRTGDSVNFYLADFRFSDNSMDYIIDTWEYVELGDLGPVMGLDFELTSSDEGMWGMNTPAYFAMDNLEGKPLSVGKNSSSEFAIYPNPSENLVTISATEKSDLRIIDLAGRIVYSQNSMIGQTSVSLENLNSGIYIVQINSNGNTRSRKLVKK